MHKENCSALCPASARLCLLVVVLFALAAGSVGCTSYVTVLQNPSAPAAVATIAPQLHSLTLLGVEFDPPLDHIADLSVSGGITLLAAVENAGLSDERDIVVSARLFQEGQNGAPDELLHETCRIDRLAAGELRVVRFTRVSYLPAYGRRYRLQVDVRPVPGEDDLTDNSRTYNILVDRY